MFKAQRARIGRPIEQCDPDPFFDVTTLRDSFCLFAWNYRELANSLLKLCDRSEGGFEPTTL